MELSATDNGVVETMPEHNNFIVWVLVGDITFYPTQLTTNLPNYATHMWKSAQALLVRTLKN